MVPTFQHWGRKHHRFTTFWKLKLRDIVNILRVLEENPQKKNNRRMSEELGTSKDTTHRQINTLGNHTAAVDLYFIN